MGGTFMEEVWQVLRGKGLERLTGEEQYFGSDRQVFEGGSVVRVRTLKNPKTWKTSECFIFSPSLLYHQ